MCYAYGRGHYRTFDGKNFYFYGTCKYVMVYLKNSFIRFGVSLINDPTCDISAPCKKKVEIHMEDVIVLLDTSVNGRPSVTINGDPVNVPYKERTPSIRLVCICNFFVDICSNNVVKCIADESLLSKF